MKLISWNVNGLRACTRKGFEAWLSRCRAEILGLQEVRSLPEELAETLQEPKHWHVLQPRTDFSIFWHRGFVKV